MTIGFCREGSIEEYPLTLAKLGDDGIVHQIDPETKETATIWTNATIIDFKGYDNP